MHNQDVPARSCGAAAEPTITLDLENIKISPEGGASIDFRYNAGTRVNPSAGWILWSEDAQGKLMRHSSTKDVAEMHYLSFGGRLWWAQVAPFAPGTMRFFAARERERPVRASAYVDVQLPRLPAPTDVAARDGGHKIIATGAARPRERIQVRTGDLVQEVEAEGSGRWTALLDVAEGRHTVVAKAVSGLLEHSPAVRTEVTIAAPPSIPLRINFPEVGRQITRLARATGTSRPLSELRATLGNGPAATTTANAGGAWEFEALRSDIHGDAEVVVENLTTGEAESRAVKVAPFAAWEVIHLYAGAMLDEDGQRHERVAVAQGRSDPFDIIEYRSAGAEEWLTLATADELGDWAFLHLVTPPRPPFALNQFVELRSISDPVERRLRVEAQAPTLTSLADGEVTSETTLTLSGTAAMPFQIVVDDEKPLLVRPDAKGHWQQEIGPLAPGLHRLTASSPRAVREVTRRTFLIEAS